MRLRPSLYFQIKLFIIFIRHISLLIIAKSSLKQNLLKRRTDYKRQLRAENAEKYCIMHSCNILT